MDKGADLYSYDVETDELTDLTVDKDIADKETGAGVEHILGASRDASYVYFVATGNLAPGATSAPATSTSSTTARSSSSPPTRSATSNRAIPST